MTAKTGRSPDDQPQSLGRSPDDGRTIRQAAKPVDRPPQGGVYKTPLGRSEGPDDGGAGMTEKREHCPMCGQTIRRNRTVGLPRCTVCGDAVRDVGDPPGHLADHSPIPDKAGRCSTCQKPTKERYGTLGHVWDHVAWQSRAPGPALDRSAHDRQAGPVNAADRQGWDYQTVADYIAALPTKLPS